MRLVAVAAGSLAAALLCVPARAEQLPLWELGAGGAYARLPDYRGSDEAHGYLLPFPYFVYRGEFFKADREGMRALFFDSRYAELDFSAGATVPVNSTRNRARAGMPDLRPTVELGPQLKLHLARAGAAQSDGRNLQLDLRLPVRLALTWRDGGPRDLGVLAFPNLNLDRKIDMAGGRWNLGLLVGGYFADRRYHEYFYGVEPQFATAQRPVYAARGGFGGWQAIVALSATYGRTWIGAFMKADWLRGAVFADSPLVRRSTNLSGGFGVSHVFARSERLVEVPR